MFEILCPPHRQEEMFWRWFLGLAAMPSAIVAVAYKLLPESPRYLGVMKKHDEAMQVKCHRLKSGVPIFGEKCCLG